MLSNARPRMFSSCRPALIRASTLSVEQTQKPKALIPNKDLVFGKTFSDHMLTVDWDASTGWSSPRIHPHSPISLDPSAVVFHYGTEVFEGMKAYKDKQGKIRMFRPDMNMKRIARSCARLALPPFDQDELLKCIKKLVQVDKRWIPNEHGYSLYIRPTVIATQVSLQSIIRGGY
eukprot:Partr_v1_DN25852_c0_g1_i4_m2847 putative branched-chain-amino-acid aminotransferase